MLAKIGDFLKPAPAARDTHRDGGRKARDEHADVNGTDALSEDVVFLSISAIRALIREEVSLAKEAPELLRKLALIEQHGLQNLPVMPGQPVSRAILDAASMMLSSSR